MTPPQKSAGTSDLAALLRRLVRNLSWLMAGELVLKASLLLCSLLVARGLGVEALGTYTLAFNAAMILIVILMCGQVEVLIRETARHPRAARTLLRRAEMLQRRVMAWLGPLALVVAVLTPEPTLRAALLAFLPFSLVRAPMLTWCAAFRGLERMDMEIKTRGIAMAITLPLLGFAVYLDAPVWTTAAAFSFGAGIGLLWLLRQETEFDAPRKDAFTPTVRELPSAAWLYRQGWPFLALGLGTQLLLRLDGFLVELVASRLEVGLYGAATLVTWGLLTAPIVIGGALYPSLSRAAERQHQRLKSLFVCTAAGTATGLVLAVLVVLLRQPIAQLLFEDPEVQQPAAALLTIFAWSLPGASATALHGTLLAAWGLQDRAFALQVMAVLISIALNLWWLPTLGVEGTAVAAIWTHSLLALAQLGVLLRRVRLG